MRWLYAGIGVVFAGVIGWISYTDALFVARLAGNSGGIAYAYPAIPDGLIVFSLLALVEGARMGPPQRSRWATFGLILGAAMTLAANVGAGLGHTVLDAVIDGLIPVCFFVAVEIVLWHVRRGRGADSLPGSPAVSPGAVPSSALAAAKASHAATAAAGNPVSQNQLVARFGITRAEARGIVQGPPAGAPPDELLTPAGAHLNGRGGG